MTLPQSDWEIAATVFETYPGGEAAFWRDWALGRLPPELMDWFRRHAANVLIEDEVREADAALAQRADRRRPFDSPEGRRRERMVLEALAFAVEVPGPITELATGGALEAEELRRRFAEALFHVLEHDLDIARESWAGESEAAVGTEVLRVVFSTLVPGAADAPPSFVEIARELKALRERSRDAGPADPTEAALRDLAGPLLLRSSEGGYRLEPSFRNYLRARLREACLRQGWQPRPGGKFKNLDAAFDALTRHRVLQVFQKVRWVKLDPWLAVDLAAVPG